MTIQRFQNLEQKFQKDVVLGKAYKKFMNEYELFGHMKIGYRL